VESNFLQLAAESSGVANTYVVVCTKTKGVMAQSGTHLPVIGVIVLRDFPEYN
jgi:hypothetical protein